MKGQELWEKAKQVIPGGNMLLSKRPELFLPEKWPAYFSKAKGCQVWDLEDNKYTDLCIMGIGTNILGYGNDEVDDAVVKSIAKGNMSTFNCPEEVMLAERLIELNTWANKVRFARTGGEANAIAIRIARAFTQRDHVAICGYHGWHDWYLASNLNSQENLQEHLLPGLEPNGVPKGLKGTSIPFNYNDFKKLKEIADSYQLAAIKMEVERSIKPNEGFLESVRQLCDERGIILIFDECTSGFRETKSGLHLKYKVFPDIAMYGKALGNGYAITAIVGRDNVMNAAQDTFISSTFWTERIGPTAALKTLEIMQRDKSYETISMGGRRIKSLWRQIFSLYDLNVSISGLDALATFKFNDLDHASAKTYITQEMLKKGWLASDKCYVSIAHTDSIIDSYEKDLRTIIEDLAVRLLKGNQLNDLLESPKCHTGFNRLN